MWISILLFFLISGHLSLNSSIISLQTVIDSEFSCLIFSLVFFISWYSLHFLWIIVALIIKNLSWVYAVYALNLLQFFYTQIVANSGPFGPLNFFYGFFTISAT